MFSVSEEVIGAIQNGYCINCLKQKESVLRDSGYIGNIAQVKKERQNILVTDVVIETSTYSSIQKVEFAVCRDCVKRSTRSTVMWSIVGALVSGLIIAGSAYMWILDDRGYRYDTRMTAVVGWSLAAMIIGATAYALVNYFRKKERYIIEQIRDHRKILGEKKYAKMVKQQEQELRIEAFVFPDDFDYRKISGLRKELREFFNKRRPKTLSEIRKIKNVDAEDVESVKFYIMMALPQNEPVRTDKGEGKQEAGKA